MKDIKSWLAQQKEIMAQSSKLPRSLHAEHERALMIIEKYREIIEYELEAIIKCGGNNDNLRDALEYFPEVDDETK
jgi:hypothetical protein